MKDTYRPMKHKENQRLRSGWFWFLPYLTDHLLLLFVCSKSKTAWKPSAATKQLSKEQLHDMMWKSRTFCTYWPSSTGLLKFHQLHTHTQMFTEEGLVCSDSMQVDMSKWVCFFVFSQLNIITQRHVSASVLTAGDTERTRSITRWIRNDYREDKATIGYWADRLCSVSTANHAWSIQPAQRDTVIKPELVFYWRPLLRQ